jgi:hypothetical protein
MIRFLGQSLPILLAPVLAHAFPYQGLQKRVRGRPTAFGACLGVCLLAITTKAIGGERGRSFAIRCSEIDEVDQAALEARILAEFTTWPGLRGDLVVSCNEGSAEVRFEPIHGSARARAVDLGASLNRVDDLLAAVHDLFVASSAPKNAGNGALTDSVVREKPRRWRLGLALAAHAERWQGNPGGDVGPNAGVAFVGATRWSLWLVGAMGWGVGSTSTVTARVIGGAVELHAEPFDHFEASLGVGVTDLLVDASGPHVAEAQSAVGWGARLSLRYALHFGAISFSAGPTLEALAQPLVAQVDTREVFRIPRLVPGFVITSSAELPLRSATEP